MPATRDPVSEWLDRPARQLLERAYANKGEWVRTRVADPSPGHVMLAAAEGIDVSGPDRPSARGGRGLDCRTRWMRAYMRALYYQHKWWSKTDGRGGTWWRRQMRLEPRHTGALQVDVGRRVPARGVIPAGRMIGIRYAAGGRSSLRAVQRKPDRARIYDDSGNAAARYSLIEKRDWSYNA